MRASRPPTAPSTSATTLARGAYGPPTGRKIQLWVIANCVSEENEIFEEWVLYNQVGTAAPSAASTCYAAARRYGNDGLSLSLGERELSEVERLQGGRRPVILRRASVRLA